MSIVAAIFLIVGSLFTMIGGIGVVRFNDLMSRVHAAAKAPTLGLLLVAIGAAIEIGSGKAVITLLLVVVLQLFTSPVATHVLARASYGQVYIELDGGDDLAQHVAAEAEEAAAAEEAKLAEKRAEQPRDQGDD
ncbi:MAG: multicomponent Na+:H+ antiporter subunit G [Candidatus Azotimanducaceae bacterium]|jgi:multicomponent Na+:H+ antiporter subunit G|tara:strand:- start:2556 stop:2957 length:402 start_codon:yes stop_codon:yes gene_type:complete